MGHKKVKKSNNKCVDWSMKKYMTVDKFCKWLIMSISPLYPFIGWHIRIFRFFIIFHFLDEFLHSFNSRESNYATSWHAYENPMI